MQMHKQTATTAALLASASLVAMAQPAPDAMRRDLLNRAEEARRAGDHAAAVDLGGRAASLRMTPSLGLLLAQEFEALGRPVDALGHAERCAREALASPGVPRAAEVRDACEAVRARAEAAVARLVVRVGPPGARIEVGGRELPPALWDVPIPLPPGRVRVSAVARDGRRFEAEETLAAGHRAEVRVAFSPPEPPRPRGRAWGAGPWVLAGVGAAAFGAAAALWSLRGSAIDARDAACDAWGCDPSSVGDNNRALAYEAASGAALGVGAAALLGAGAWLLFGGRPAPRAAVAYAPGGALLVVGGAL